MWDIHVTNVNTSHHKQYYLKIHQKTAHGDEDLKYYCDQCAFETVWHDSLKKHREAIHEGVRFSCNHCAYKVKSNQRLKVHQGSIHEVKSTCVVNVSFSPKKW